MRKLASTFIDLTFDACLKAFWRRKALLRFLRQHGISENHLATWSADETKRDYLERLFFDLIDQNNSSGQQAILEMAKSVAQMTHFPDLENWEDSAEKIQQAKITVARLKNEVDKINNLARDEKRQKERRVQAEKTRIKNINSRQTLQKLMNDLNELAMQQGTAEAGYKFETWFYALANYFEIESRPPYTTSGRQIDGALTLDGTTFLVETKFTQKKIGSPDIDVFMSKVTSKADNTMGIYISMFGYTSGAIEGASRDRTPLLLLDHSHIYNLILANILSLNEVIRRVKRHASQTGEAYLAVDKFSG